MTHRLFLSLHCVLCLFTLVLVIESQRNRSFTPFPNDFFRWSETSCLEKLLFSSSSRFDVEGLEEWTFSRGRVLGRVSYFRKTKNIVLIEFVACYSVTNVKNKWLRKENEEGRDYLTTKMATERNVGK